MTAFRKVSPGLLGLILAAGAAGATGTFDQGEGGFEPPHPLDLATLGRGVAAGDHEVKITADSSVKVTQNVVEFSGHVHANRRGMTLGTERVRYDRGSLRLDAAGNVKVERPGFELTCGKMSLHTQHEIGVAWDAPRVLQVRKDAAGQATDRTEINAIQISFYTAEDRVEGLERVRIYRWVRRGAEMVLDFKISADALDSNLLTQRSVLKGDVQVESPTYRITANRLILDQIKQRFTAVGNAKVEGINGQGKITNVVEGNKLVHFIDQRRTIVSGGVSGFFEPEKQGGVRTIDMNAERQKESEVPILPLQGIGSSP